MPPFNPYLSTRWRCVVYFPSLSLKPRDRTPLLILKETEWAPEPVWTFRKRERCLPLPGFEHKTVQPLAMFPTLCTHYAICSIPQRPYQSASLHQLLTATKQIRLYLLCACAPTDHWVIDTCMCSERVLPSLTESNHISWHTDTRYAYTAEFMAYGKGRV
jgi:hypothetical protein